MGVAVCVCVCARVSEYVGVGAKWAKGEYTSTHLHQVINSSLCLGVEVGLTVESAHSHAEVRVDKVDAALPRRLLCFL